MPLRILIAHMSLFLRPLREMHLSSKTKPKLRWHQSLLKNFHIKKAAYEDSFFVVLSIFYAALALAFSVFSN